MSTNHATAPIFTCLKFLLGLRGERTFFALSRERCSTGHFPIPRQILQAVFLYVVVCLKPKKNYAVSQLEGWKEGRKKGGCGCLFVS